MKKLTITLALLAVCSAVEANDDRWNYFSATLPFNECKPLKTMFTNIGLPTRVYNNMPDDMIPKTFANSLRIILDRKAKVHLSKNGVYATVEANMVISAIPDIRLFLAHGAKTCEEMRADYIVYAMENLK